MILTETYCYYFEPTYPFPSKDRIDKLEWLVGRLTLENESLKKGLQNSLSQADRNRKSSSGGDSSLAVSGRGVDL
ncbi:MAG: hypothetical protein J7J88_00400 [Dehalococcoidia bacterium]|nr:hypothetical protein [Dehalococcoidia bacterium]